MRKKIFFLIVLYSLSISCLYIFFCHGRFSPFSLKLSDINVKSEFDLPEKDSYILNIWNSRLPRAIYFNGRKIFPYYVKSKKGINVAYMVVPEDYVVRGVNALYIPDGGRYSMKIRNFFGAAKSKNIYVLHKSSNFLKEIKFDFLKFILAASFVFSLLILASNFFTRLGVETFAIYWIPYIPYFLCFGLFLLASLFSPFRLVMSDSAFIVLGLIILSIVKMPLLAFSLSKRCKAPHGNPGPGANIVPEAISRVFTDGGDLSELLVFLFMWLISFAAISMVFAFDILGELLINIAYLVLIVSVSMKMLRKLNNYLKKRGHGEI